MRRLRVLLFPLVSLAFILSLPSVSRGDTIFTATLSGAQEPVPTGSTATGFAKVDVNAAETMITVDLSWVSLIGGEATAAHIHCCAPPGVAAGVLFPLAGVAPAASGSISGQTFAINSIQVAELFAGLMYVDIHDPTYPAGEIRGQFRQVGVAATPEPGTFALLGLGLLFLAAMVCFQKNTASVPALRS